MTLPADPYKAPNVVLPPPTIAGQPMGLPHKQVISELAPSGNPITEPLLAPPPGTSPAIGQSIFGVQQRADRAARVAPPPTVTGTQVPLAGQGIPEAPDTWFGQPPRFEGPLTRGGATDAKLAQLTNELANVEQQLMSGVTSPTGTAFDPDRATQLFQKRMQLQDEISKLESQPETRGLRSPDRPLDPSLMSTGPSTIRFNPTQRETYTMKDLSEMSIEIENYLKANPRSGQAGELRNDLTAIRNELDRRKKARQ